MNENEWVEFHKKKLKAIVSKRLSSCIEVVAKDIESFLIDSSCGVPLYKCLELIELYIRAATEEHDSKEGIVSRKRKQLKRNMNPLLSTHPDKVFLRNRHERTGYISELLARLIHTNETGVFKIAYKNPKMSKKNASRKIAQWLLKLGAIAQSKEDRKGICLETYDKGRGENAAERAAARIRMAHKRWVPGSLPGLPDSHYVSSKMTISNEKPKNKFIKNNLTVELSSLWKPLSKSSRFVTPLKK